MATIKCKGLTGVTFDLTIADMGVTTMNGLTALAQAIEGHNITVAMYGEISAAKNPSINQTNDGAKTLTAAGLVDGDIVICTPADDPSSLTKEERADQKLYIAEAKRRGLAAEDTTTTYYRTANIYDKTMLPNPYENDAYNVDDDENTGALEPRRPWDVGSIAAPASIADAVQGGTLVDLQVWYDSADTSTITPAANDEQTVQQWVDKSSFAHNANPTNGNQKPTYENTVLQPTVGGYGYIEFDGSQAFSINPVAWTQGIAGFTVFIVTKPTSEVNGDVLLTTNTGDFKIAHNGSTWTVGMNGVTAVPTSNANTYTTSYNWAIFTLVYDAANPLVFRLDKTGYALGAHTPPATSSGANNALYLGYDGSNPSFTGFIGEVIMFDKALTSTEYGNVENYLSNKWGL